MRGVDESDEERENRIDNIIKGQITSLTTDVLSPVPVLDVAVQKGVFTVVDAFNDFFEFEDGANIYDVKKSNDMLKSLGMFGISAERASQVKELVMLSQRGVFVDDYNKERYVSNSDKKLLEKLIIPSILVSTGLVPGAELNNIISKSIKSSKKDASTKPIWKQEEDAEKAENNIKTMKKAKREGRGELTRRQMEILNSKIEYEEAKLHNKNHNFIDKYEAEMEAYNKEKKEYEMLLLGSYESKSEMRDKAPMLYKRRFGRGSKYHRKYNDRNVVDRAVRGSK
jgi:hypothetical protein